MVLEMGNEALILLKAHGVVCAGDSLLQCFAFTNYHEENCRRQYKTMQVGDPYRFSDEEKSIFRKSLNSPSLLKKVWDQHYCKLS